MIEVKLFLSFLLKLTLMAIPLATVHYILATSTALAPPLQQVLEIHMFVYALTAIGFGVLILVGRKDFDKIGFAFAGLVLVKMVVSFVFLYPYLQLSNLEVKTFVFNFFAVYLLYLFYEAREAYILIQKGPFSSQM